MKVPCRRSSRKAEPKAKKPRLCKGDQKSCKAKPVAIISSESEQEADSEDEAESEDDPETYSSHEVCSDVLCCLVA